MSSPAVTRKRSRSQHLEQDELSPEKPASKANTPLGSLKRRRLNKYGSSSTSASKSKSVLGRLGGLFGFGREDGKEKENRGIDGDDEEKDELGYEESGIWEVVVSDDEEEQVTTPVVKDMRASGRDKKKGKGNGDIWEMPGPDPEEEHARNPAAVITKGKKTPERSRTVSAPVSRTKESETEMASQRRSVGRPKKADILKKAKAVSREAIRKRLSAENQEGLEVEDAAETQATRKGGRSRKTDAAEIVAEDETEDTMAITPSGRKLGRPRKEEIVESAKQAPKGILTPTKNGARKSRKSVAFEDKEMEQDEAEVDLGFKDLPNSSSKNLSRVPKGRKSSEDSIDDLAKPNEPPAKSKKLSAKPKDLTVPEEEVDSDDSDLACAVCGRLDSQEPNEILICDNCDFAVHQECYKVPVVPDGDWFCRDCRPEDDKLEFDLEDGDVLTEAASSLLDIEGFEDHLRGMQRLLLDILTGQKRIKLRWHDEEMQKVHQIVEQTVLAGEGNSILVIGARGCGKTTVRLPVSQFAVLTDHPACGISNIRPFRQTSREFSCCTTEWIHSY
jgi:origin recognition complex subunit 4